MNDNKVIVTKGKIYIEEHEVMITEYDGLMLLLPDRGTGLLNTSMDDCSWNLSEYLEGVIGDCSSIVVKYVRSSTEYDIVNPFSVRALWNNSSDNDKFIHAGSFKIDSTSNDIIGEFNHNIISTFDELNPYYYMEVYVYE